jgi:hypothetical protein
MTASSLFDIFADPPPGLVRELREWLYKPLAQVARVTRISPRR